MKIETVRERACASVADTVVLVFMCVFVSSGRTDSG